jgi:hypothetical protein
MHGYSDRINHALAFAAKHHDQQVRRGTRLPYLTAAPNVAVILTRYGQDDDTVVAGILYDVVQDWVREGAASDLLHQRIGEKFGEAVLGSLLGVVERRLDDDGVELSHEERRADLLSRLATSDGRGRWAFAASLVHACGRLLADVSRTEFPATVWAQLPGGREGTTAWYRRVHDQLRAAGFDAPIMSELGRMVETLEARVVAERAARSGTRAGA